MGKLAIVNELWQGGGKQSAQEGTYELREYYLDENAVDYVIFKAPHQEETMEIKDGVAGGETIFPLLEAAANVLRREDPEKIFAVNASCDDDIPVILHLNQKYGGDLAVVWIDAHADINSEDESTTHLFYGMPIRAMLGGCRGFVPGKKMEPNQFINVGGRDFDPPEKDFFAKNGMHCFAPGTPELEREVVSAIQQAGKTHVHIHFDFDSIDPGEFPNTVIPVPNGMSREDAYKLMKILEMNFEVVGFSMHEYVPCGEQDGFVDALVKLGKEIGAPEEQRDDNMPFNM